MNKSITIIIILFLQLSYFVFGQDSLSLHSKPNGRSFEVTTLNLPENLLNVYPAKTVFEQKIGKEIFYYPKELEKNEYVSIYNNSFIGTVHQCYEDHRPLILTPDAIWLTICQGMSIHINENIDSLENIIFISEKPKNIEVRCDELENNPELWANAIDSITDQTKKYTKNDYYSLFVSQFSTTTAIEKTAYNVALLESYKQVFTYSILTMCGIPNITIAGNKNDWQIIYTKLDQLKEIGLAEWGESLKPIIQQFINVYDNKIDTLFWQDIYKSKIEYDEFNTSGWIIKFYPYISKTIHVKDGEPIGENGRSDKEIFIKNKFIEGEKYLLSKINLGNFPSGMSQIDINWKFPLSEMEMEIYAGFFGAQQFEDHSLMPLISWVVTKKSSRKIDHLFLPKNSEKVEHKFEESENTKDIKLR